MEALTPQQLAGDWHAEYNKGEYFSAAGLYKAAADGFSLIGDEISAAEMTNNCRVAYLKGGDANFALEVVNGTDQIFAINGDIKRQAMAIENRAAALEGINQFDEAIVEYKQSAELFYQIGEYEMRAYVCQSISSVLMKRGKYLEAYGTMRAGVMSVKEPNLTQRLLQNLMNAPFKFMK